MGEFASKGVAGSGLGLGIAGTALGLLNANGNGGGLLGGLLGGGCQNAQLGQALNALAEKDAKISGTDGHALQRQSGRGSLQADAC